MSYKDLGRTGGYDPHECGHVEEASSNSTMHTSIAGSALEVIVVSGLGCLVGIILAMFIAPSSLPAHFFGGVFVGAASGLAMIWIDGSPYPGENHTLETTLSEEIKILIRLLLPNRENAIGWIVLPLAIIAIIALG